MSISVTDLSDAHGERLAILDPLFRDYGGAPSFCGPAVTLKLFEDNSLVRSVLEEPGAGRVLVVDGGGSLRCALLGDQLGELGVKNGWSGVIVYGCVRDARRLGELALGVRALNTHPRKSVKKGVGERDVAVTFAGVTIRPGQWVYADEDGIGVADSKLD